MPSKRAQHRPMPKEVWLARELRKAPTRSFKWRTELLARWGIDPAQVSDQESYERAHHASRVLYEAIFKAWDEEGVVLHDLIKQAGLTSTDH